jgi:hypothetical protein
VFALGFGLGGVARSLFDAPRLWLMRLRVPVQTVELGVTGAAPVRQIAFSSVIR